jgi:kinesin family protein 23
LFAYGVTGSGKTFTMSGKAVDCGIMPRCLDVIFNSIAQFKATKYIFKPDRMNGFESQSKADAMHERQKEILEKAREAGRTPRSR